MEEETIYHTPTLQIRIEIQKKVISVLTVTLSGLGDLRLASYIADTTWAYCEILRDIWVSIRKQDR